MIKSMTGYGRHKEIRGGIDITVEVKSVNSRYFDCSVRINRIYSAFEEKLKALVAGSISRGKIEIYCNIDIVDGEKVDLSVNREYLEGYLGALNTIKSDYGISGEVDLKMLASKPEVFIARKADDEMERIWAEVEPVALKALEDFDKMRVTEGAKLKSDLENRIAAIDENRKALAELAPNSVKEYYTKMTERIKSLLGDVTVDESRLLTECAVYADRCDVTEELVRLGSHISQFRGMLGQNIPVGKKMDFLLQEINREINTTGSKCNNTEMTDIVVSAKAEAEKIREQIQNIE